MKYTKLNFFKPLYKSWIAGKEYSSILGKKYSLNCPSTEISFCEVEEAGPIEVDLAVQTARLTFDQSLWTKQDVQEKAYILQLTANLLRDKVSEIALKESIQTGRALREMNAQLSRLPEWLDYFASLIRTQEGSMPPFKGPYINYIKRVPLGVVGQITPFNHPMLIAVKKISAALATGNSIVLKPPDLAPCCIIEFADILRSAGLPDGIFNVIPGFGSTTGQFMVSKKEFNKIDFTGGTETGKKIGSWSGANITSLTSELGGKTPMIVFEDADIKKVVKGTCFGTFIASGQTCVTGSRLLVQQNIYKEVINRLVRKTKKIRVGHPQDQSSQMGPVISNLQELKILLMIQHAREDGGKILCGGHKLKKEKGFFLEPTIIACHPENELAREEVFGPVLAVMTFNNEDDAVQMANNSPYGLAAAVWSKSIFRCHRVANSIDAGLIWINDHHRNDPSSPWGGMKDSGLGRENGLDAFIEYTQAKSIVVNMSDEPFDWFIEEYNVRYG